ncbi:hypothetical protein LMH73_018160 [Vibrio splendidus]|nr:hypothetical protein [Vibrio splendidus]MCC4882939.1 hypothetical protein [Vibrio splendidus]
MEMSFTASLEQIRKQPLIFSSVCMSVNRAMFRFDNHETFSGIELPKRLLVRIDWFEMSHREAMELIMNKVSIHTGRKVMSCEISF